jgi:hypothetical protein
MPNSKTSKLRIRKLEVFKRNNISDETTLRVIHIVRNFVRSIFLDRNDPSKAEKITPEKWIIQSRICTSWVKRDDCPTDPITSIKVNNIVAYQTNALATNIILIRTALVESQDRLNDLLNINFPFCFVVSEDKYLECKNKI